MGSINNIIILHIQTTQKAKVFIELQTINSCIIGGEKINNNNKDNNKNTECIKKDETCHSDLSNKMKEILESKDLEIQNLKDTLLRNRADFENFKKRSYRDLNEFKKFSTERIIINMIEVCDTFELAIDSTRKTDNSESIIKGIELVFKQFFSILKANGLEKISVCVGNEFDPKIHKAINQIETIKHKDNTIIEILKPGYTLHSKVVRPASVVVAKNPENV